MACFATEQEIAMNGKHWPATLALGLLLTIPLTALGQGKVTITSPADGATLDALDENRLVYDVEPGPRGDHVHVYVDNKEVGILRKLKGSYLLESLDSGKRKLCVKVVNKAHVPIGVEKCVQITVK
jgi:oxalate decarboxylase/phosphoglucose isomerase-like protein (cupin superfamily)